MRVVDYSNYVDQELVSFMNTGDERILAEIYSRYWNKLLIVAYNRLGNQEEAEECVQDVLYKLWKLRDTFTLQHSSLSAYLATAIRNQAFDVIVKNYRKRQRADGYLLLDNTDYSPSPERLLMIRELVERIDKAIDSLPPQCRLVFKLSRESGLSNKQIADKLNISENTVKSHLQKAKRDIRDDMELLTPLLIIQYIIGSSI